ncbi:alcohol dehydrogenase catalytic domain-containing protein [Bacillus dakarensis]|uniref:alcohol dehydrogenase catalytic domain-containing protein n=1 Tax=Robertmurraya dakarensis TaxID=1926278 RepID=UPI00137A178A|nr:zinc-binding dehydrogenase [Bacillus dakarensis]
MTFDQKTMKAARFYELKEPLKIESIPVPTIKDDEVLVQVKAVGLCGSDVSIAIGGYIIPTQNPITLGHEAAGVVVEVGSQVEDWKPGDRVSLFPGVKCRSCFNCLSGNEHRCTNAQTMGVNRDGALAEYIAWPAKSLVKLPDNLPFTIGAIITDAVATPYHALKYRGGLEKGESIAIYGAGGLGMHAIQIAKFLGAGKIIAVDVREEQLERAKKAGADITINAEVENPVKRIKEETNGQGADISAEFIGNKVTYDQAISSIRWGGRAVFVGIGPEPVSVKPLKLIQRQLDLRGSFGFRIDTIRELAKLAAEGQLELESSITHTFTLEEANKALEYLHKKIENPIRVLVTFP